MRQIRYRQAALDELADIIEFIANDKPGASRRVLEEIEACAAHIAVFPESAPRVENLVRAELNGIRRAIVAPYRTVALYYFANEDSIDIVSVRRTEQDDPWM